jgi:tetratricopeptide (TPR) repeat protein
MLPSGLSAAVTANWRSGTTQMHAHAKRPIELFLAGTTPESAKRRRGVMHRELGELSEAMADFIALIDADHGNAEARYERARTLLELGRPSDALTDAEVGAWLRPYTADFHSLRAQILGRLGRNEEAAAASVQAEKYSPPSELTELGRVLRGIGPITPENLQELLRHREATDLEIGPARNRAQHHSTAFHAAKRMSKRRSSCAGLPA